MGIISYRAPRIRMPGSAQDKRRDLRLSLTLIITVTMLAMALALPAYYENPSGEENAADGGRAGATVTTPSINKVQSAAGRVELMARLKSIVAKAEGVYGIYVLEMDTGHGFGINEHRWFNAASTIKLPILAKLYQEIEAGGIRREDVMTFTSADFEEGTGSIQFSGSGTQWTVGQLAEKMMRESDNVAKNILLRFLGADSVEEFINGIGSPYRLYRNETTPASMANLLKLIYENSIVGPRLTDEMFSLMTDTDIESRLPLYLKGVRIAHKTGSWENTLSDIGIVFLDDKPFVICVYSQDAGSWQTAEETMGRIAAIVYAFEATR